MRLIDADKLPYEDIKCVDGKTYMVVNAYDIDNAPTISVQPKEKTGKWKYGYAFPDGNYCKCSECKEIIKCIYPMHYCPNCGTKMEVEK